MENTSLTPLLESIVYDNPTYDFPFHIIRFEMMEMLLHQEEIQYFMTQCHKKLKNEHPIYSTIFLSAFQQILDTESVDLYLLPKEEYIDKIEGFISTLERMKITRIDKDSPDGDMLTAMS